LEMQQFTGRDGFEVPEHHTPQRAGVLGKD
jgi:hypothetical protein